MTNEELPTERPRRSISVQILAVVGVAVIVLVVVGVGIIMQEQQALVEETIPNQTYPDNTTCYIEEYEIFEENGSAFSRTFYTMVPCTEPHDLERTDRIYG
jgi:hypothetical protein